MEQLHITVTPITKLSEVSEDHTGEIPESELYCYIDGSCKPNPGQMYAGILVRFRNRTIFRKNFHGGYGTNNEAEFCALIQALKVLKQAGLEDHPCSKVPAVIVSDSRNLVMAVEGKHKLKQPRLSLRLEEVRELIRHIGQEFKIIWTDRKNNLAHDISQDPVVEP